MPEYGPRPRTAKSVGFWLSYRFVSHGEYTLFGHWAAPCPRVGEALNIDGKLHRVLMVKWSRKKHSTTPFQVCLELEGHAMGEWEGDDV